MFTEIKIPAFGGRIIGFSVPEDGVCWAMSTKGLHKVELGFSAKVQTDPAHAENYEIFDTDANILDYKGKRSRMLGENGGEPLLASPNKHQLKRGPKGTVSALGDSWESFDIVGADGKPMQQLRFLDTSGDWCYGTFSTDGRFVVVGVPNQLYAYYWRG